LRSDDRSACDLPHRRGAFRASGRLAAGESEAPSKCVTVCTRFEFISPGRGAVFDFSGSLFVFADFEADL